MMSLMRTQIAELNSQQFFFPEGFPEQLLKKEFNSICLWFLLVFFYCPEREGGGSGPTKKNLKRLLLITDFYLPMFFRFSG